MRSVTFSHDGRYLAAGDDDGTVRLWDAGTGHPVATLTGHTGEVSSVAYSPDGRVLAVDIEPSLIEHLRERADELPREEVLGRYSLVSTADEVVDTYLPLVRDLDADVVTLQMASLDQEGLIAMLGADVLPRLRAAAG